MRIFLILFLITASIASAKEVEISTEKLKDGRVVKVIRTTQYEFLDEAQVDDEIAKKQADKAEIVSAKPASQETEDLVK